MTTTSTPTGSLTRLPGLLPGLALCVTVTLVAAALQSAETRLVGEPYLEALVLAILLGVAICSAWKSGPRWAPGIAFSAKVLRRSPWCCSAPGSAPPPYWRSDDSRRASTAQLLRLVVQAT